MGEADLIEGLLKAVQAGGNGALIFFAWATWRIERRVYALEAVVRQALKKEAS